MTYTLSADTLKSQTDLRDIAATLWGAPIRSHAHYNVYASRWRDDGSKPAFTVYETHFKDYGGDGISGDVFTFLQTDLNLTFKESLSWLAEYLGNPVIEPTTPRQPITTRTVELDVPSIEWQHAARVALTDTQTYLWSDRRDAKRALNYLRHVRGLSDETIRRAGYGYNPNWRKVDWIDPQTGKNIRLAPGIIEPWANDGQLLALRIRCRVGNLAEALDIHPDTIRGKLSPKYLNLSGSRQRSAMLNADAIQPGCSVLMVEGGFDAYLAGQLLDDVVVVTCGSATSLPDDHHIEKLRTAKAVYLLLDDDEAGQYATEQLQNLLGHSAIPLTLPDGNDITEFVLHHNGDLPALIQQAVSSAWWRNGIPDTVRTALLTHFRPITAAVIEMVNTALHQNLINGEDFTLVELIEAGKQTHFRLTGSNIRRAMNEVEGYFFAKLDTYNNYDCSVSNSENNCGRPSVHYRVLPVENVNAAILYWSVPRIIEQHFDPFIDEDTPLIPLSVELLVAAGVDVNFAPELCEQLNYTYASVFASQDEEIQRARELARWDIDRLRASLHFTYSSQFEPDDLIRSASDYRAAFLRATHDPNVRRSRREMRDLLGISNATVDTVLCHAQLTRANPDGEFEMLELTSAGNLELRVQQMSRTIKGYPRALIITFPDGTTVERSYRGSEHAAYVRKMLAQGATVSVKFQVANHYVDAPETTESTETASVQRASRRVSKPRKSVSRNRQTRRRYYGPGFDPVWAKAQLKRIMEAGGHIACMDENRCVNSATGEVLVNPSVQELFSLVKPEVNIA